MHNKRGMAASLLNALHCKFIQYEILRPCLFSAFGTLVMYSNFSISYHRRHTANSSYILCHDTPGSLSKPTYRPGSLLRNREHLTVLSRYHCRHTHHRAFVPFHYNMDKLFRSWNRKCLDSPHSTHRCGNCHRWLDLHSPPLSSWGRE